MKRSALLSGTPYVDVTNKTPERPQLRATRSARHLVPANFLLLENIHSVGVKSVGKDLQDNRLDLGVQSLSYRFEIM